MITHQIKKKQYALQLQMKWNQRSHELIIPIDQSNNKEFFSSPGIHNYTYHIIQNERIYNTTWQSDQSILYHNANIPHQSKRLC